MSLPGCFLTFGGPIGNIASIGPFRFAGRADVLHYDDESAMATRRTDRFLALNDSRLAAFLTAECEEKRDRQLDRIVEQHVRPTAHRMIAAHMRGEWRVDPNDAEDVVSSVVLMMIRKLRAALILEEESLQNLEAYVTTVTRNVLRDLVRAKSPGRMRVRSRLRHLFAHDRRLALWNCDGVAVAGLSSQLDRQPLEPETENFSRALRNVPASPDRAPDALIKLFALLGEPLRFTTLVSAFVELWGIRDGETSNIEAVADEGNRPGARLEWRQYLDLLWRELLGLPVRQRSALLLNLRMPHSENAIALFIAAGIARFEEIAEAIGMVPQQLTAIWDELPLDDATIASSLGSSRQQVINLRKAARERLVRRMATHSRPGQ
jgi:DNA-directed RNA polymerase specialized sigma24 family protein